MILVKNDNRQGSLEGLGLSYTPIKSYCTAVLGCRDRLRVLGQNGIWYCEIGLFQIVIQGWHQYSIFIFIMMRGAGVKGTHGLECGSNGRIILSYEETLVFCTSLLGLGLVQVYGGFVVFVGIIPSMLQEGIMIVICIHGRGGRGCYGGCMRGLLRKKEIIAFSFGLVGKFLDRTSGGASSKNGIYLSLYGLEGHRFVIVRNHIIIIISSKLVTMHIKCYIWGVIVVAVFVSRTVCV